MRQRIVITIVVSACFLPGLAGCSATAPLQKEAPVETPVFSEASLPAAMDMSPAGGAGEGAIAIVNGVSLDRATFEEALIESHGLQLLEQLILLTAARQRAKDKSLDVTEADIQFEHDDALQRLAQPLSDPNARTLTSDEAGQLLEQFLAAKNISPREWRWRMEQRACLRKIAEAEVAEMKVTENDLRTEYEIVHGEKVRIRHLQVSSLGAAAKARSQIVAGKDFELVARQTSENTISAAQGGLLRPFSRKDPSLTPLLREAAFTLEPGQISQPIRDGQSYHVIRVEERIAPTATGFEQVDREGLRRHLTDRLVGQRQRALETELFVAAAVDIRHPELERQFRERFRGGAQP